MVEWCSEVFTRAGPGACAQVARPTVRGTPPHFAEEGGTQERRFVRPRGEVLRPNFGVLKIGLQQFIAKGPKDPDRACERVKRAATIFS